MWVLINPQNQHIIAQNRKKHTLLKQETDMTNAEIKTASDGDIVTKTYRRCYQRWEYRKGRIRKVSIEEINARRYVLRSIKP
jgi:hypothetical protein